MNSYFEKRIHSWESNPVPLSHESTARRPASRLLKSVANSSLELKNANHSVVTGKPAGALEQNWLFIVPPLA